MSALSNVHASTLLNTSLRSGTYYLALFLTDPTASGTGTEVSGGGYARKIINFSAPSLVSGKEQVSNSAPVDFGTLTADLGTVAYWGIYDALTAGKDVYKRQPLSRSARARRPLPCSVATLAHGASRKSSRRKASVSRGAIPSSAKWEANISTDGRRARTARLPLW